MWLKIFIEFFKVVKDNTKVYISLWDLVSKSIRHFLRVLYAWKYEYQSKINIFKCRYQNSN